MVGIGIGWAHSKRLMSNEKCISAVISQQEVNTNVAPVHGVAWRVVVAVVWCIYYLHCSPSI